MCSTPSHSLTRCSSPFFVISRLYLCHTCTASPQQSGKKKLYKKTGRVSKMCNTIGYTYRLARKGLY